MNSIDSMATALANIVGASHLSSAPDDITAYGGLEPLIVVWPGSPPEAAAVLKECSERGVAVGVIGAGTRVSRHWPVKGDRPRVALDTRRMTNILDVDEVSLLVHTQTGILVQHLEQALGRQGLTLGPFPAALQDSTLGGLLAAPPPGAYSPQVGWLTDACRSISVAHADGTTIQTRVTPGSATGPDLARLYLGSRGGLGVISTAVLRIHRLPDETIALAYLFESLPQAAAAARQLLARGMRPARLTLFSPEQSSRLLGDLTLPEQPICFATLGGPAELVAGMRALLDEVLVEAGGSELPRSVARAWWHRFAAGSALPRPAGTKVQGVRLPHSQLAAALHAAPDQLGGQPLSLWIDEITLHGVTLWFSTASATREALNTALLDRGLEPLRASFHPLMEQLRAKLDPFDTLVVMEG